MDDHSRELVVRDSGGTVTPLPRPRLTNLSIAEMLRVADVLAQSRMVKDVATMAQAFAKITYGQELGIGPMSALKGIYFIEGNLTPSATTLAGLIQNSGRFSYRLLEWTDKVCAIEFFDRGQSSGPPSRYTWDEASKVSTPQGRLTDKANWKNYPKSMLFARAMGQGARAYCPGVLGGAPVYTAEELDAPLVDHETGEIVDGTFAPVPEEPTEPGITEEQKIQIRVLLGNLKLNAPQRAAWFVEHKFPPLGELTEAQATEVLTELRDELQPPAAPTPELVADEPAA